MAFILVLTSLCHPVNLVKDFGIQDELPSMLSFLGFPNTDPEKCREIAEPGRNG